MARSVFRQIGHYLGGEVLRMLAGLVTFPTFTRVLTTGQYGLMSVVNSTVPMVMPFAKCGMSFAAERFYAEYRAKGSENEFLATTVLFSFAWCVGFCLLYEGVLLAGLLLLPESVLPARGTGRTLIRLLMFIGIQIFLKAQLAVLLQIARAKQQTLLYNFATTFEVYSSIGLSLTLLFTLGFQLHWLFLGQMLATATTLAIVFWRIRKGLPIGRALFRRDIVRESLRFGTPMIWNEIAAVAQSMADRYVLLILLGEESVGVYSAGFNVSAILVSLCVTPIYSTLGPVVFQKYADGGWEGARAFLEPVCRWVLRLLIPLICGVEATAAPLVVVLASAKYHEAAFVTRMNFSGMALWSATNILALAILISKQTRLHRNVVVTGTVFNVLLAIGLVHVWEIRGAALAALATAVVSSAVLLARAYRLLPMKIWGLYLLPSLLSSLAMLWAISHIQFHSVWATLFCRVGAGIGIYVPLLMFLDREARADAAKALAKVRARLGRGPR